MQPKTRHISLVALTLAFSALAVLGAAFGVYLVLLGAYPEGGNGSLAHVGAVTAGLASGFLAIVFALFALYFGLRARRRPPPTRGDATLS